MNGHLIGISMVFFLMQNALANEHRHLSRDPATHQPLAWLRLRWPSATRWRTNRCKRQA
jgi:hypothetical protein